MLGESHLEVVVFLLQSLSSAVSDPCLLPCHGSALTEKMRIAFPPMADRCEDEDARLKVELKDCRRNIAECIKETE
jgi:hypothetical protein